MVRLQGLSSAEQLLTRLSREHVYVPTYVRVVSACRLLSISLSLSADVSKPQCRPYVVGYLYVVVYAAVG